MQRTQRLSLLPDEQRHVRSAPLSPATMHAASSGATVSGVGGFPTDTHVEAALAHGQLLQAALHCLPEVAGRAPACCAQARACVHKCSLQALFFLAQLWQFLCMTASKVRWWLMTVDLNDSSLYSNKKLRYVWC